VHNLKVGGANHQAASHEIHELYPGIANKQEWPRVAHLQQVPGDGDLGKGANAAIKANQQIRLREEAQPVKEVGRINAASHRLIRGEAIPRGDGVPKHLATL
jgi:hypothetical protein